MITTAEYLNKLIEQKNTLADNLAEKGVDATHNETFETLIPKVLDISSGSSTQLGIYPIGEDSRPTGSVTVIEGTTSLYQYIFSNDANVVSVKLPQTLTTLSAYSFQNCSNLQKINLPSTIKEIPNYCFDGCVSLSEVDFSDNTSIIGNYAFQNTDITILKLNEHLANIGSYAFSGCMNLTQVSGTANKVTIGTYAFSKSGVTNEFVNSLFNNITDLVYSGFWFSSCDLLTDVEVGCFYAGMFLNCKNLKTAKAKSVIGSGETGNSVFAGCTSLISATLPEGTTKLGSSIFNNCFSLKTVYIPLSITSTVNSCLTSTSTSSYIFNGCTALENVQFGTEEDWNDENGRHWNFSIRLNISDNLTVECILNIFKALKDLTGETAKTLTLGSVNLAKLTNEQKLIAMNKNWTLA